MKLKTLLRGGVLGGALAVSAFGAANAQEKTGSGVERIHDTKSGGEFVREYGDFAAKALTEAGVDSELIEHHRKNPSLPIPPEWFSIIGTFMLLYGVALSADVGSYTILGKDFTSNKDKLMWLLGVPAAHFGMAEITKIADSASLTAMNFAAVCFFIYLLKELNFGDEDSVDDQAEDSVDDQAEDYKSTLENSGSFLDRIRRSKSLLAISKLRSGMAAKLTAVGAAALVEATAVSLDAGAAGPGILVEAKKMGLTLTEANGIMASGVLVCTAIAIWANKYRDVILSNISSDNAEAIGNAGASSVFTYFMLKSLATGLEGLGVDLADPEVNQWIILALTGVSPILSYWWQTRGSVEKKVLDEA